MIKNFLTKEYIDRYVAKLENEFEKDKIGVEVISFKSYFCRSFHNIWGEWEPNGSNMKSHIFYQWLEGWGDRHFISCCAYMSKLSLIKLIKFSSS